MNRFALLSLVRSLTRHRLYAALNIGGLAIGIAVFLVLGLYVRFETGYERWLPHHERIYVVQTVWNLPGNPANGAYPFTMGGLLDQLRQDFPATAGARIRGGEGGGKVLRSGGATAEDIAQVDPSFLQVIELPMVSGDPARALHSPTDAVVSETFARKYFGTSDPIGHAVTIAVDGPMTYRVVGVFKDLPRNSDLKFSALVPLPRLPRDPQWFHWGSSSVLTFLRFDTPAAAKGFAEKLPPFVDRRGLADLGKDASKTQRLALLPIADRHLTPEGGASASRQTTVVTLGTVGLLTLLIAVVNYVNLATARAGLRAREVAMRKVLGADRSALVRQFIGEAVLTVAVAALAGLILAEIGLPMVNAAGGLSLAIPYAAVLPALAALVMVVGIVSGFYPALVLSHFPAAAVLASARTPSGGRGGSRVRGALVVVQFSLAIAMMIGTAVLVAQTRHVRRTDLGFKRDGLIVVRSLADDLVDPTRRRAFVQAAASLRGVTGVTLSNDAVGGTGESNSDNVALPGVAGPGPSLNWVIVGPRFLDVYGAHLVAGRWFDDAHRIDDAQKRPAGDGYSIVVNRRALPTLGFHSPGDAVGRTVGGGKPRTIIGVVDDLRFGSPRTPNSPTYYIYNGDPSELNDVVVTVRHTGDPRVVLQQLRGTWQRMLPQVPFKADTADQRLTEFYVSDDRATRLFAIGAGLAVLIGCIGLWGLASFNTTRRVKEVGIRKTLGASSTDIVKLLVGQFLRPVLAANLIAWPLAFVAMRIWLTGFDDRIALSPLYFLVASLTAAIVAALTVFGHSLRASRAAPAWALRNE